PPQDGYEHACAHTEHGNEFVKKAASFVEKLIHVEQNYAKELRKLCKQYKRKDEETSKYSSVRCFAKLVTETNDLAGQRELVAEYWQAEVLDQMKVVIKDITAERKTHMIEGAKRINELKLTMDQLDKAKKHYERASEEAENAQNALEKADNDPNSTKAKIDKLTQVLRAKEAAAEESKNNYILQLENTNLKRRLHYNSEMPQVFQNMQDMNAKRMERFSSLVTQCAECNRRVFPVVNTCLDNVVQASAAVDPVKDNQLVIQERKTGYPIPGDEEFQQYGPKKINRRKPKKKVEPRPDFSHLPPEQRRKKLATKVNDFDSQISKATADRTAMEKMQNVYKENPKLGDPNSLGQSLEQTSQKIAALTEERDKFAAWLQEAHDSLLKASQGQQGGASPRPSPKNKKKNDKNGKSEPVPAQKAQAAP
ncbi:Formin-binding protein 1-like, partial [Geodia barretti]